MWNAVRNDVWYFFLVGWMYFWLFYRQFLVELIAICSVILHFAMQTNISSSFFFFLLSLLLLCLLIHLYDVKFAPNTFRSIIIASFSFKCLLCSNVLLSDFIRQIHYKRNKKQTIYDQSCDLNDSEFWPLGGAHLFRAHWLALSYVWFLVQYQKSLTYKTTIFNVKKLVFLIHFAEHTHTHMFSFQLYCRHLSLRLICTLTQFGLVLSTVETQLNWAFRFYDCINNLYIFFFRQIAIM